MLLTFTHPHVISNLNDFIGKYFFFHTVKVKDSQMLFGHHFIWKIPNKKKSVIQIWNDMSNEKSK